MQICKRLFHRFSRLQGPAPTNIVHLLQKTKSLVGPGFSKSQPAQNSKSPPAPCVKPVLFHATGKKRWAVQLHAPGQDSGLRKNLSEPLPLRQRMAHKRPKQNNRALSPHVSFSFCPMCQATPERTSLGNLFGKDVAAKVLGVSVL